MPLVFKPVSTDEEILQLAHMADEIWHEYWPGKLSYAQVDYMVDKLQSVEALTADIRGKAYEYWALINDGHFVGYVGVHAERDAARLFISKIYLFDSERGKGFASQAIGFLEDICRDRGLKSMYLTVNKYNDLAKNVYFAKGFTIVDSVVKSIGQGYVMDDYIMEKHL
ncbi:MAG: GNAT family N-acetyltransferase [Eggerthellaceae bacterium]|nr:GNAT family N-acetyltransferase [Eggerthellaceae bacterium]